MKTVTRMIALLVGLMVFAPQPADALYLKNGIDLGGNIRSTNIIRHADFDELSFIQQRNTLRLRLEYKWLQRGKAFGKYNVPFLKRSDIYVFYRGAYDSVYDLTPGMIEREDLQGDAISPQAGSLESLGKEERDRAKIENRIREAYIDLYFKKLPLTMRIGKQQVVWGESDGFRMLDRANSLDLSWHFFQELPPPGYGFDELREPHFMVKALWNFKRIGPLSQTFMEAYWNPGWDWNPGKISFLPKPWGVRLLDPISNSAQSGALQSSFCRGPTGGKDCLSLMNGTELFKQGDFANNIRDNSQVGVRLHFMAGSTEWTLNYLYKRFTPDGSPIALVKGVPEGTNFTVADNIRGGTQDIDAETYCRNLVLDPEIESIARRFPWAAREICIEYFIPYVHTIGFSFNWFEPRFTQTVWRVESVIDFDLPFYDGDKRVAMFSGAPGANPLLPGISERDMWKGMLAFDRPTWIRWLNKKTTFFLSGQFFWHYIIEHERRRCSVNGEPEYIGNDRSNGKNPNFEGYSADPGALCGGITGAEFPFEGEQKGFVGGLDLPKLNAPSGALRDTIHQWELLMTFAMLGFYKGGTMVPAFIYLLDPVNSFSQEVALGLDWFYTPDVAFNVTTRLIWAGAPWDAYAGHKNKDDIDEGQIFDPWFLAGGSRGRSETSFQVTYQF